jgi:hypothetical protein
MIFKIHKRNVAGAGAGRKSAQSVALLCKLSESEFCARNRQVFFSNRNKERERYYLLPGMGGSAAHRKQMKFLKWSVITALLISMVLAALLYWLNDVRRF